MLRSDLRDYSETYTVVKGAIDLLAAATNENDKPQKNITFKHNATFKQHLKLKYINRQCRRS